MEMNNAPRFAANNGVAEAQVWLAQQNADREAWLAQRQQDLTLLNQQNQAAEAEMDRQTVQRAWAGYHQRQAEEQGERVCAMINQGGRATQECMSREHFDEYYSQWGR